MGRLSTTPTEHTATPRITGHTKGIFSGSVFCSISGIYYAPLLKNILNHDGTMPAEGIIRYFNPPIDKISHCNIQFRNDLYQPLTNRSYIVHIILIEILRSKIIYKHPNLPPLLDNKEKEAEHIIKTDIEFSYQQKIQEIKDNMTEETKSQYKIAQLHSKEKANNFLYNYIDSLQI